MDACMVLGVDLLDVPNGDPASYCRLCLSEMDVEELFPDGQDPRQDVIERIHECTGIQITPDEDYPSSVCWMCALSLEEFQCFRERCRRYDVLIRRKRKEIASSIIQGGNSTAYEIVIRDDDGSFDDYDEDEDQPPVGGPLLQIATVQEQFDGQQSNENSLLEPTSYQPEVEDLKPDKATLDAYAEQFQSANSSSVQRDTSTPNEAERMFNCHHCDKKFFSRANLWSHRRIHEGNLPFQCGDCGTTFGRAKSLMQHKQKYHSKDSKEDPPLRLKCDFCPRVFPRKGDRSQHMKWMHPALYPGRDDSTDRPSTATSTISHERSTPASAGISDPPNKKNIATASPAVSEISRFMCNMCTDSSFLTDALLEEHIKKMHPKGTILTCSLCPKTFKSRQTLRMHILNHQGKLPHKCEDCGSRFDRKFYLAKHRERYHNSADAPTVQCRLKCKFCPRMFIRKTDRKTHTRMVHSKEVRIKREKMDRGYGDAETTEDPEEKTTPLPTTSNELSFGCLRCGEQFPSAEMLREHTEDQHLKKKSEISDDKSLVLKAAQIKQEPGTASGHVHTALAKKATKKIRIDRSMLSNVRRPYKCPYCPKSFSRHYVMKEHTFIHTGSLRYRCDECLAMFNRPHYLRQHKLKYHSQNSQLKFRAVKCRFCSRSFVRMQDITVHERIAHGVEQDGPVDREIVGEPVNGGSEDGDLGDDHEDDNYDDEDYNDQSTIDPEIRDVVVTLERIPDDVLQTLDNSYEEENDDEEEDELSNDVASGSTPSETPVPRARLNMNITLHRCPKCFKVFKTRKSLKHHMMYHENQLPFACDECGVQFARNRTLELHKEKYHSEDAPYTGERFSCDYCPRIFLRDRDKLFHHKTVHSLERSYANRDEGTPELKKPKIKKRKDYVCVLCCERFETEKLCQRHINEHHPVEAQPTTPAQSPIPAMMVTPKLELDQALSEEVNPSEAVVASEDYTTLPLQASEEMEPAKNVEPSENEEPSENAEASAESKESPEDTKPFKDMNSFKDEDSFKDMEIFENMKPSEKENGKPSEDVNSSENSQLPEDIKPIIHSTSPAAAAISQAVVGQQSSTGVRPYKLCRCATCVAIFKNRDNWRAHIQQHSSVRPHHCEQCLIKRKAGRTNRKVGSVGFKCQQCPKVFSTSNSLQVHQRLHTSDLRFPCDECDMKYDRYRLLQTHKERYHSEDAMQQPPPNTFRCQLCTRTFMRNRDLRFHMESVHAN